MLGLFGTLNMGQRALQTQRQGVEVAGHNLANVNQPGYSRQRLVVQTSSALSTGIGSQGTGVDAVAIQQLRNTMVDRQIQDEASVRGSLEAQQQALQYAQTSLGQSVDSQTGTLAAQGSAGSYDLGTAISDVFNSFQALAAQPASADARQNTVVQAQNLANRLNDVDKRLGSLRSTLNQSLQNDTGSANQLLADIARLNGQISDAEAGSAGTANDLRDTRQQKIEALAKIVKIDAGEDGNGNVNISVGGTDLITGRNLVDKLQAYDSGNGQVKIRTQAGGATLALTGGSLHGTMEARDVGIEGLRKSLDTLAGTLVKQVNALHQPGFSLTGTTGEAFFTGTTAATIKVNQSLIDNPSLVQASGAAGARSDNQVALALAQLANQPAAELGNQTYSQYFGQTVAATAQSLASVNGQLKDQQKVENMLTQQRDAVSGVSLDEEMTNLIQYQKSFEASARLINTIDQMLQTVLSLKQ